MVQFLYISGRKFRVSVGGMFSDYFDLKYIVTQILKKTNSDWNDL